MDKKSSHNTPSASSGNASPAPARAPAGSTDPGNEVVNALLKLLRDADRQVTASREMGDEAQAAVATYRRIAADLATRSELTSAQLTSHQRRAGVRPDARAA